jgi:hypothetical protein
MALTRGPGNGVAKGVPRLLTLSYELVMEIFCRLPSASDAVNLAATCSHLHRVFADRRNRIYILRSITDLSRQRDYEVEQGFSGMNFRRCSLQLAGSADPSGSPYSRSALKMASRRR